MNEFDKQVRGISIILLIFMISITGLPYYIAHRDDAKFDGLCKTAYGQDWEYYYEDDMCRKEAVRCLVDGSGNVTDVCESAHKYENISYKIIETGVD